MKKQFIQDGWANLHRLHESLELSFELLVFCLLHCVGAVVPSFPRLTLGIHNTALGESRQTCLLPHAQLASVAQLQVMKRRLSRPATKTNLILVAMQLRRKRQPLPLSS